MRPTDNFCHGCSDERHQRAMANILTRASCLAISISLSLSFARSVAESFSVHRHSTVNRVSCARSMGTQKFSAHISWDLCLSSNIAHSLARVRSALLFLFVWPAAKKNRKGEKGEKTQQQATTTTSDNNNYNNGDNNKGKQQGWHKLSAHFLCIFKCPYILPL